MFIVKNVSKGYQSEFALHNISLEIGKGLHFITGASGSGKTTLLKILAGMEQNFDGEVFYCGKSVKSLTSKEKSYFYNNIFGFIWQDFNLLEEKTVLENIVLPLYLKKSQATMNAGKLLKELKIADLADKQVKYLSGGQKQRVAIARELMKNPQVILADEPTSALDEKTSRETMELLRSVSKSRTVIIVTHDTSFIKERDSVFELDKGELISSAKCTTVKASELKPLGQQGLSLKNSVVMMKTNIKRNMGRFLVSTLALMTASILLLTTFSGAINSSSQDAFHKLLETYGEGLLDLSIVGSFTSAGGTDGNKSDKPNADVSQNIAGLYDDYAEDERVDFAAYMQAFNNIAVTVDGKTHNVKSSGNSPAINKLITGKMPADNLKEVVVPESFVKSLGISNAQAVGKEVEFRASIYNWDTGSPVLKDVSTKAVIVGVADTMVVYEYEGKTTEYTIDDSFFFGKAALDEMRKQAGVTKSQINFLIRAKSPADMISLKDELNKNSIVPIGRFELVEDIVRLNTQTKEQSGSAGAIIGILSVVMVIAVFLITGIMRKREFAVYKVSGFHNSHLNLLNLAETMAAAIAAMLLMVITSPLTGLVTKALFSVEIQNYKMIATGLLLVILTAAAAYGTTAAVYMKTKISTALKTGDR